MRRRNIGPRDPPVRGPSSQVPARHCNSTRANARSQASARFRNAALSINPETKRRNGPWRANDTSDPTRSCATPACRGVHGDVPLQGLYFGRGIVGLGTLVPKRLCHGPDKTRRTVGSGECVQESRRGSVLSTCWPRLLSLAEAQRGNRRRIFLDVWDCHTCAAVSCFS